MAGLVLMILQAKADIVIDANTRSHLYGAISTRSGTQGSTAKTHECLRSLFGPLKEGKIKYDTVGLQQQRQTASSRKTICLTQLHLVWGDYSI